LDNWDHYKVDAMSSCCWSVAVRPGPTRPGPVRSISPRPVSVSLTWSEYGGSVAVQPGSLVSVLPGPAAEARVRVGDDVTVAGTTCPVRRVQSRPVLSRRVASRRVPSRPVRPVLLKAKPAGRAAQRGVRHRLHLDDRRSLIDETPPRGVTTNHRDPRSSPDLTRSH